MMTDSATTILTSQHLTELGFAIALAASLWGRHWGYVVFLALALNESHQDLRYPFHAWARDMLLGVPVNGANKHVLQSTLIYVATMFGLAVLVLLTPMLLRASAGRRLMVVGTTIVLGMLAIELISEHNMDAIIYHREGPFSRTAITYFVGAFLIACGALMTPRRKRPTGPIGAPQSLSGDA
jgi:hypothetical protein